MRVKKVPVKKKAAEKKAPRKKSGSVWDRIEPLGVGLDDGIKINIYGRSATGKTTLWATFPKPILAIICSGGKKAGELLSINTPEYRKTIKKVVVHDSGEIEELVQMQESTEEFATVVLDHASGLQGLVLKEILGLDNLPKQLSWGLATQQQYGQLALRVKEHLSSLLDLSCNVVIVAQEREFNVENESEVITPYVASALTPSIVGWLHPACNYIAETFIRPKTVSKRIKVGKSTIDQEERVEGKVEYCLRVGPHDVYTTKFRVPKGRELPSTIVDPSYKKIKALIDGK